MKIKKCMIIAAVILLLGNHRGYLSAETTGSTEADITFESGLLSLAQISSFSFGTQTISAAAETYPALQSNVFLEVSDLRGTGVGWKVTALASPFYSGANPSLRGARINLLSGATVSSQLPAIAPTVESSVVLDCDSGASSPIATAPATKGLGVWRIEWLGTENNNTNVALDILGGVATVGNHSATITWTLTDAP